MQSVHTLLKLARMPLMSGYKRKYSMENFRWECAPNMARRNKDSLNASMNDFNIPPEKDCTGSSKVALHDQKWSR